MSFIFFFPVVSSKVGEITATFPSKPWPTLVVGATIVKCAVPAPLRK